MIFKAVLDLIYPPLCLWCRERCETKFFCEACWRLCEPPDPVDRCRHCFGEVDQIRALCKTCRKESKLRAPRALVFGEESPARLIQEKESLTGFAMLQWIQLELELPDLIVPMPDEDSESVGELFAQWLECRSIRALRRGGDFFELREELDEDLDILLIDAGNPMEFLQKGTLALAEAFPKNIFLLSLFDDDSFSDY